MRYLHPEEEMNEGMHGYSFLGQFFTMGKGNDDRFSFELFA